MSSMSSSSTADELLQLVPRHSPQATEHSSPIFLHVHLRELQSVLQLQRTIFSRDSGAAGKSVVVGSSRPLPESIPIAVGPMQDGPSTLAPGSTLWHCDS